MLATLVGVSTQDGIAAVGTLAVPNATLVLPPTMRCHFEFEGVAPHAQLWLDPLELDQFDHSLLPALRAGPDGSIVLHVGSFDVAGPLTLSLQAGRYRLSGGRIAIHPAVDSGSMGLRVGEVIDLASGHPLARANSDWLLTIRQQGLYQVRFEATP
jgi:hypothetical protein